MTGDEAIRKANLSIQKLIWKNAERENLPYKESAKEVYLNLLRLVEADDAKVQRKRIRPKDERS